MSYYVIYITLFSMPDIKEKDDKNQKAAATQKIKMNVINGLLTAEELEHASKQVGFIAVDYPEEGTQKLVLFMKSLLMISYLASKF